MHACKVDCCLAGATALLVPYKPEHVPTYHSWMQDETLLALTASEPLTLEQEVLNQQEWHRDPHKLTFIVTKPNQMPTQYPNDLTHNMCGDVNAFFSAILPPINDDDDDYEPSQPPKADDDNDANQQLSAELEIMIAEPKYRRQGIAREALLMMMSFIISNVPQVAEFVVKVGDTNGPSLQLFASLGFTVRKHLVVFEQTELSLSIVDAGLLISRECKTMNYIVRA